MDLELKEFGATIAIGAFTTFLAYYIFWIFAPAAWVQRFKMNWHRVSENKMALLAVAITLFAVGIVVEDLSDHFADSRFALFSGDIDEYLRHRALFASDPKDAPLAVELAASGRLAEFTLDPRLRTIAVLVEQDILSQRTTTVPKTEQTRIATAVYYVAKNTVSGLDYYSQELSKIQTRIDFTRSLAIISGISLLAVITLVGAFRIGKKHFEKRHGTRLCAALIAVVIFCAIAFVAEEGEFNRRAFGYFATLDNQQLPQIRRQSANFSSDQNDVHLTVEEGTQLSSGFSGMTYFDSSRFLVVHDSKVGLDTDLTPRLGMIVVRPDAFHYSPVSIDWLGPTNVASDLEAICGIPGLPSQFLMAESGYFQGKFGRVFRIDVKRAATHWNATVNQIWNWPAGTTNIEAIACISTPGGRVLLV